MPMVTKLSGMGTFQLWSAPDLLALPPLALGNCHRAVLKRLHAQGLVQLHNIVVESPRGASHINPIELRRSFTYFVAGSIPILFQVVAPCFEGSSVVRT